MHQRGERVEDADLDVTALEADRVGQGVAVDRGAGDGGMDEPDVHVRQAGLPRDGPLGLVERLALDGIDELLELAFGDRLLRLPAFLAVGRREALDELTGDADDHLARPEARHLLGLLERHRAVVDDGRDVRDRARLHVRQALALAADTADGAVPGLIDVEDERLGELGADVQRGAGGEGLVPVALPDPAPERHQASRSESGRDRRLGPGDAVAARPPALGHVRASAAAAIERRHGGGHEIAGRDPALDQVVGHSDEQLRLVGIEHERDDTRTQHPADVARRTP